MAGLSWLGASFVTAQILSETKKGNDQDTFEGKMYRTDQFPRIQLVMTAINSYGPTILAAKYIQNRKYFSDVSVERLLEIIQGCIVNLNENAELAAISLGMTPSVFGTLNFANLKEIPQNAYDVPEDEVDLDDGQF